MPYNIVWILKDGRIVIDRKLECETAEEAETSAGIEMMQFEAENVDTYLIAEIV